MNSEIIWKSNEYNSIEHFEVTHSAVQIKVHSVIAGHVDGKPFDVRYSALITPGWCVESTTIYSKVADTINNFHLKKNGSGWLLNNEAMPAFKGLIYIDISLTPFSNTLPINNLKLEKDQRAVIEVIYFDLLNGIVKPVTQKYTRIDEDMYEYDNLDKKFKAVLEVDADGFVVTYPELFKRQ